MGLFVVLKKSRLDGDAGLGGALTLHTEKINAVQEANERSMKCEPETYFIGEIELVGEVRGASSFSLDGENEDTVIMQKFPAYNPY